MIRVSPSLLESYRLFMTEEWFTVERMREAITGKFEPTPQILLGQAYHKMLENFTSVHEMHLVHGNPTSAEMTVTQDGFTFAYEACVEPVADFLRANAVHEVYGTMEIRTQFGVVSVATKADAVWGNIGGEWKTTESAIQLAKYMDSVQWKLCAWTLGLRAIDYRIMRMEQREDGVWTVADSNSVQCIWSDSLKAEVLDLIHGLIEFHHAQDLRAYLLPYYMRTAA